MFLSIVISVAIFAPVAPGVPVVSCSSCWPVCPCRSCRICGMSGLQAPLDPGMQQWWDAQNWGHAAARPAPHVPVPPAGLGPAVGVQVPGAPAGPRQVPWPRHPPQHLMGLCLLQHLVGKAPQAMLHGGASTLTYQHLWSMQFLGQPLMVLPMFLQSTSSQHWVG